MTTSLQLNGNGRLSGPDLSGEILRGGGQAWPSERIAVLEVN